jgi:hypothetical protein
VIALNNMRQNKYFTDKPLEVALFANDAGVLGAVVETVYSADRYPYVVKFDTGYQDVYADSELEAV